MLRPSVTFLCCLMLSGPSYSQAPSTAIPKTELNYRQIEDSLLVCDKQNVTCHENLKKTDAEPIQDKWGVIFGVGTIGMFLGVILKGWIDKK
jgi:hypothetical protein